MEVQRIAEGSEMGTMYTDMEARHIVEVLDRKRKQLDAEIARFKAEKEKEYHIFERSLRGIIESSGKKSDSKSESHSIVGERSSKQIPSRNVLAGRDSMQGHSSRHQRDREKSKQSVLSRSLQEASGFTLLSGQNNARAEEHNASRREDLPAHHHVEDHSQGQGQVLPSQRPAASRSSESDSCLSFQGSHMQEQRPNRKVRQPTQHRPEDYDPTHERELEFQGLFTPSYLPLLDSTGRDIVSITPNIEPQLLSPQNESHVNTSPDNVKRAATQSTIPAHSTSKHPTKPLRLSLPTNARSLDSTTNPPRLSSSIPARPTSLCTSLHSNLRSPTSKKPRSPKRVHFQIDNVVVPPSSTPPTKAPTSSTVYIMSWPNNPTPPKEESLNPKHSNCGDMVEGKQNIAKEQQSTDGEQRTSAEPHGDPTPIQYHGKPSDDSDPGAAKEKADDEPTAAAVITAAAETAGEEPEQMFPFDEDLADEEETENEADDDGTSSVHSLASSMKLGSPNASSLPIDIKYPPKIDPRDE